MRMPTKRRSVRSRRPESAPTRPYDVSAPKKPTNVSVNGDLLLQARALNINLSQALEDRLIDLVLAARERGWLAENERAIADYNNRIEKTGVFSDPVRRF
jgi:antitoxin CcdA